MPAAQNNLGNAYRALERRSEAHAAYDEALRRTNQVPARPGELAQIYSNRGLALPQQGKHAAACACGLQWERACGRFHETARPVKTASVAQVRQPLYRQSLGRWKHYEATFADLFARLPVV